MTMLSQSMRIAMVIMVLIALTFFAGCSKQPVTTTEETSSSSAITSDVGIEVESDSQKPSDATGTVTEFSADVVQKSSGMTSQGKLYVKGNKIRQEVAAGPQKSTIIVRGDKNVAWLINDEAKAYLEMESPPDELLKAPGNATDMEKALEGVSERKLLGQEEVNGHLCDKYEIKFKDKSLGTQTQWISKKLNMVIKLEDKAGGLTMEHRNIKEGNVPDSVFELPSGYSKMDFSDMPPGMPSGP